MARRGTKHVFVVQSVAHPLIQTASRREMGILFAIVATTRFVTFATMAELFGAYNPELSCTVRLGVDMPFWERQVAEI